MSSRPTDDMEDPTVKFVDANQPQWRRGVDGRVCASTTTPFAVRAATAAVPAATTKQHSLDMDRIERPMAQGGLSTG